MAAKRKKASKRVSSRARTSRSASKKKRSYYGKKSRRA